MWNFFDIITATSGKCSDASLENSTSPIIGEFSIDSRTVNQGDIFVALISDTNDGHDYIVSAIKNGAIAVIISKKIESILIPQIIVEDTQTALTNLAIFIRNNFKGTVIGITGSVGKTSTKDALFTVLSKFGNTYATKGNLNNHLGVPLTLIHMPKNTQFAIIEMGMSALGEIRHLTHIAHPHIAVITSVKKAHLEFFDGIEEIAQAKAEIFEGLADTIEKGGNDLSGSGIAIYNADSNGIDILQSASEHLAEKSICYGKKDILNVVIDNNNQNISAIINNDKISYTLPALGTHRIYNSLAVLNVVSALGLNMQIATEALLDSLPTLGRGLSQLVNIKDGAITLFDESYNSAPASMKASLEILGQLETDGRRIAVLGDMLELGTESIELHKSIKQSLIDNKIDLLFSCGENFKHLFDEIPEKMRGKWELFSSDLAPQVLQILKDNDVVIVKGSLGSNMKAVITSIKNIK